MCIDYPHKINNIKGNKAEVICPKFGETEELKIDLVPNVKIGEYVLAQNGFAVAVIPREEAEGTLKILKNAKKI